MSIKVKQEGHLLSTLACTYAPQLHFDLRQMYIAMYVRCKPIRTMGYKFWPLRVAAALLLEYLAHIRSSYFVLSGDCWQKGGGRVAGIVSVNSKMPKSMFTLKIYVHIDTYQVLVTELGWLSRTDLRDSDCMKVILVTRKKTIKQTKH